MGLYIKSTQSNVKEIIISSVLPLGLDSYVNLNN